MTVTSNLQLWLDATDALTIYTIGTDVSEWASKDVAGRVLRFIDVGDPSATPPSFHLPGDFSPASIEFDYNNTMTIDHPLIDIKTVISVHKYKSPRDNRYEYSLNVLKY